MFGCQCHADLQNLLPFHRDINAWCWNKRDNSSIYLLRIKNRKKILMQKFKQWHVLKNINAYLKDMSNGMFGKCHYNIWYSKSTKWNKCNFPRNYDEQKPNIFLYNLGYSTFFAKRMAKMLEQT